MSGTIDGRSIGELIDAVPWGRLAHAYDFALDAPAMLRSQIGSVDVDDDFEDWLVTSMVHQGTPHSATAPTLWLMRRIVDANPGHPALGPCLAALAACATAIGRFGTQSGDECATGESAPALYTSPKGDPSWASAMPPGYVAPPKADGKVNRDYFLACVPDLDTLRFCVGDWQETIIRSLEDQLELDDALFAAAAFMTLWAASPVADALTTLVRDASVAEHHRAGALFALSRAGHDTTDLVAAGERAMRFAIALGQPDRAGNVEVLVDALRDLSWLSATFPLGLPGAEPWLIAAVISAVLERTDVGSAPDSVVDALVSVLARPSGPFGATDEWGPVLEWAFPDRVQRGVVQPVPLPASLSGLHVRLLTALVGNDKVWTPTSGNDKLALGRVGLPHDRTAVANLLSRHDPRRRSRRIGSLVAKLMASLRRAARGK